MALQQGGAGIAVNLKGEGSAWTRGSRIRRSKLICWGHMWRDIDKSWF